MYFASTEDAMPTTFTIKQVPDALADRLRRRAEDNRRSLQRELLLILEDAATLRVSEPPAPAYLPVVASTRARAQRDAGKLSLDALWKRARKLGAASPSESAAIIRRDRDARRR